MERAKSPSVNNYIYDRYGENWYTADDDPVALLRAESRTRNGWIMSELAKRFPAEAGLRPKVLDIGCGAGFLSNELARAGCRVVGVDVSEPSLAVARAHDPTGTVDYRPGDAAHLEFAPSTFDAVCAMDFLEHVERPGEVIGEASRVLKPGGRFFFYTFNRNPLSWLVIIKGVEWFVRNTPPDMHCLRYFIKPAELRQMCVENRLKIESSRGLAPVIWQLPFWKLIAAGKVDPRFAFKFTRHTLLGYLASGIRIA